MVEFGFWIFLDYSAHFIFKFSVLSLKSSEFGIRNRGIIINGGEEFLYVLDDRNGEFGDITPVSVWSHNLGFGRRVCHFL